MVMLLKEYLSSGDSEEAIRCLLDLEVPHFHHELVYEVLQTGLLAQKIIALVINNQGACFSPYCPSPYIFVNIIFGFRRCLS